MKKLKNKFLVIILFSIAFVLLLTVKSNATVSLSVSPSTKEIEPGKSVNITVKVSGGAGQIALSASNGTLSKSSLWLDNSSETITCTAGSTNGATISITAKGTIGDYETEEDVSKSASTSIKIKKKEEVAQTPTTPSNNTTTTTKKPTTTTTTKVDTKTDTKTETKKEDNFYISSITLKGIKENGEQTDINLSPSFNKDTYEYTCNIASDIEKIDLQKDAGEYTNSVIVTGLDDLKEGENIIKLVLSAEDHESKTYTIKVIKEKQEIVETVANIEEDKQEIEVPQEEKKEIMVSMPLWVFIVMQIIIIVIEVLIIYLVPWKNLFKIKNKNIDIDE